MNSGTAKKIKKVARITINKQMNELFATLAQKPWYKRLWYALHLVFGVKKVIRFSFSGESDVRSAKSEGGTYRRDAKNAK